MQEIKVIEIHGDDFLLGVKPFQFHRNHPLYGFLQQSLHSASCRGRIELLGQLLRDGRTTPCALLPHDTPLDDSTGQSDEVDTRMFVITLIFCGHECPDQIRRQMLIIHMHPVLLIHIVCTQDLSVNRIHL